MGADMHRPAGARHDRYIPRPKRAIARRNASRRQLLCDRDLASDSNMAMVRQHDQINALLHPWLLHPVNDASELRVSSANGAQASLRANTAVVRGQIRVGKPQDGHPGLMYWKQVLEEDLRNVRQARLVGLASGWDGTKFLYNGFCLSGRMTGRDTLGR